MRLRGRAVPAAQGKRMYRLSCLCWFALLLSAAQLGAQEVRLDEQPATDTYHVSCRVQITGKLPLPERTIEVEGQSTIEYDERILGRSAQTAAVDRTLRL